jgi:hypothetical protein
MMTRKRFLRRAHGVDHAATTAGLALFLQECEVEGDGVIVVPSLKNISATVLTEVLRLELANRLYKERSLPWGKGTISLCSDATLKNYRNAKVYLALWSSNHLVDEIEQLGSWRSLVWVTWLPDEANAWAEKFNPSLF